MKTKKYVKMCPVIDDWCPNFDKNMVMVICYTNLHSDEIGIFHRVCVWGADDLGMEIDFTGSNLKKKCLETYKKVISLNNLSKKKLKEMGFYYA